MGSLTAHWSWDPSLIYVTVAGLMYLIGGLRPGTSRSRRLEPRGRASARVAHSLRVWRAS